MSRVSFTEAMDMVDDDMPDGAFFAMAHDIAGLEYGDGFDEVANSVRQSTTLRDIPCTMKGCNRRFASKQARAQHYGAKHAVKP